jgi:hypothetical protein
MAIGMSACAAISAPKRILKILGIMVAFYFFFFAIFLLTGKVGGAYRALPYWGTFGSICLLALLSSSESKLLRGVAIAAACVHLMFGASIFIVTNKRGMETYPEFYSHATGVRHHELATIRDKYDFDYLSLIPDLRLCQSVFLDLPQHVSRDNRAARFFVINIALFMENNNITHYLAIPYRNASPLIGDAFHPGFSKAEVKADCTVEEETRDGRITYKLVRGKW